MHRFHCPTLVSSDATQPAGDAMPILSGAMVSLDADESRHALRVLRLKAGDAVELFDGRGTTALGTLADRDGSHVIVRVTSAHHTPPPTPHIDLATAIPKGPRADAMIEQLSQLGVDCVIPLSTERSVVRPRDAKLDRFQRAAIESAKQSGRAHVMRVEPIATLPAVLARPNDVRLIATPPRQGGTPADVAALLARASTVLIMIGPEGGFTDAELAAAERVGCAPWTFGANIMRIETAAAAAAAVTRYLTTR